MITLIQILLTLGLQTTLASEFLPVTFSAVIQDVSMSSRCGEGALIEFDNEFGTVRVKPTYVYGKGCSGREHFEPVVEFAQSQIVETIEDGCGSVTYTAESRIGTVTLEDHRERRCRDSKSRMPFVVRLNQFSNTIHMKSWSHLIEESAQFLSGRH